MSHILVTVNDDEVRIPVGTSVAELMGQLDYPDRGVAVAVDGEVTPRSQWDRALHPGARVDVLSAVQGG